MRQAIVTKYLSPTNFRGARIKATSGSGLTLTVPYDHALNPDGNHIAAAQALAAKLQWSGEWSGGATPGSGYAFVWRERLPDFTV